MKNRDRHRKIVLTVGSLMMVLMRAVFCTGDDDNLTS